MRIRLAAIGVVAGVAGGGILVGLAAGQATQPRPGPGSDVVPIEGRVAVTNSPTVTIANTPTVVAMQSGEWKVAVTSMPAVRLPAPSFLTVGRKYRITWPSGQQEEVAVRTIADGWLLGDRVDGEGRISRWINPAMALAIEAR